MVNNKILGHECVYEKKKWLSITGLCNNNCRFCLDSERPDKHHKDSSDLKKEITDARKEGCTKLILSGGDPTIHPDLIDLVSYAKREGFSKIQVVTNGRMFASKKFTDEIITAGLDEVTFSIHGNNSKIHDTLTSVPGSFKQVVKGVMNVFENEKSMIVNTDTCITKLNYKQIPKIIRFIVEKLGITEINLMTMLPQGNAWKYKDEIMCEPKLLAPYVREVIKYAVEKNIVLWLSRFPGEYLEGCESFIEDPYKLVDEVNGREEMFRDYESPPCEGNMCYWCPINKICEELKEAKKYLKNDQTQNCRAPALKDKKEIIFDEIITLDHNFKQKLEKVDIDHEKRYLIRLPKPTKRVLEYEKICPKLSDVLPFLKRFNDSKVYLSGFPPCTFTRKGLLNMIPYEESIDYSEFVNDNQIEYLRLAEELAKRSKIKKEECESCIFHKDCKGLYQNYVRLFGFGEIDPIQTMIGEIRINNTCNQNCLFCNTDQNAENMFETQQEVLNKIDEFSEQNTLILVISGKEPTLDRNLSKIIKYAKKKIPHIQLQTNAIRFSDDNYATSIIKAGLDSVFVSIHADNEELSAKITRAPGTFEKTIEGLRNLKQKGIEVSVNIVINSLNYSMLPEIIKFIHTHISPRKVVFSFVSPIVKALENKFIIPRITSALPYMKKAFDYCIKNKIDFSIPSRCGIPLCFVEDYKKYHGDYSELERFFNTSDKTKLERCKNCKYGHLCSGIWKDYLSIHGTDEFT